MGLRPDLLWRLLNLTRRRGFSRCFGSNLFRHENVPALTSCATRNRLPAFPGFRKLSRPHLFIEKAGWWSCLHAERGDQGPGSFAVILGTTRWVLSQIASWWLSLIHQSPITVS